VVPRTIWHVSGTDRPSDLYVGREPRTTSGVDGAHPQPRWRGQRAGHGRTL